MKTPSKIILIILYIITCSGCSINSPNQATGNKTNAPNPIPTVIVNTVESSSNSRDNTTTPALNMNKDNSKQNDLIFTFTQSMFRQYENTALCRNSNETDRKITYKFYNQLYRRIIEGTTTQALLINDLFTMFPCPFSPDPSKVRPATKDEITGHWIFPKDSQSLRFPPESSAKQSIHPEKTACEVVIYEPNREHKTLLLSGPRGCFVKSKEDAQRLYRGQAVASWSLADKGRVRINRFDNENYFEEWDMHIVTNRFVFQNVIFKPGDIISYMRRGVNNYAFDAAIQFRHLVRIPGTNQKGESTSSKD